MLKRIAKIFLYGLLVLIGVVFSVSNRARSELTLFPLPYAVTVPIFLFAIAVLLLGLLLGWALARLKIARTVRHDKATAARVVALENELKALRSEKRIR